MIPFNKASITDLEKKYVLESLESSRICGDNKFTKKANEIILEKFGFNSLLTTSCSSSLDLSAILCDLKEGDEVILPSYTFVSTANSFIMRGAKLVFCDIQPDTLNIDPKKIKEKITDNTKVIVVVHYAGVACDMDPIMVIAKEYGLKVVEDAAQAIGSYYKGQILGTIGDYGTISFHETKNIVMGEGGLTIIKDDKDFELAEMIREKGTNRKQFFKGFVDKYSWQVPGFSLLPSDILSALLCAQLERFDEIQSKRLNVWNHYNEFLEKYEKAGIIRRPIIPSYATNNAHMYYLLFNSEPERKEFIDFLRNDEIEAPFHYVPLHLSTMGKKLGYNEGDLPITEEYSSRLVRLPLYADMTNEELEKVINTMKEFFEAKYES